MKDQFDEMLSPAQDLWEDYLSYYLCFFLFMWGMAAHAANAYRAFGQVATLPVIFQATVSSILAFMSFWLGGGALKRLYRNELGK